MADQSLNQTPNASDFNHVVESVVKAVLKVGQTQDLEEAIVIRDQLRRLPDMLLTEVLNQVMLNLVSIDPLLCRWFIVDVFLCDASPDGRADVAERINILLADLQSTQGTTPEKPL
ncbi:MAG: hypothetical protein KME18_26305 [Phormidium tanganyikae FI6-MK23]|nr:hypothetical protein [Phormidium tanganyikae FI6-MK23]